MENMVRKEEDVTYLNHIRDCNRLESISYLPFIVQETTLGWVRQDRANILKEYGDIISVRDSFLSFAPSIATSEYETAIAVLVDRLTEAGHVAPKRNELYDVARRVRAPALFRMERAAVSFFGIAACGVHLNGYVRKNDNMFLWIGKRANDRRIEPGKLDNIVAGGQPSGLSLRDNLIKEAAEEAAMPRTLAMRARPVGMVRYCLDTGTGLRRDTLFCYDLDLSEGFIPHNADGETDSFHLLSLEEVCRLMRETKDFKFNVPLVIIDFLIRHGYLSADNETDYAALCLGLHGVEHPFPA